MSRLACLFVLVAPFWFCSTLCAAEPHAVFVVGTHHYSPHTVIPGLASVLEKQGFRTTVINPPWDPEKDRRGLPGLEALDNADIGIFFVRFLQLEDVQLNHITRFIESGKPIVGLRTSTHAFNFPADHPKHSLNDGFGRDVLGTPYRIHLHGKTQITKAESASNHPILEGVNVDEWESSGSLYLTQTHGDIEPILFGTGSPKKAGKKTNRFGTHELKAKMTAPIAWTWKNKFGSRVFNTSLGHVDDFSDPNSLRVMVNGISWAAGQPISQDALKPIHAKDSK
ncbi:MAG: ThuA domain-containing protein [Planctomycetota bacterium]